MIGTIVDPKIGDTVYKCFNGELESMVILDFGLADSSCTIPTYVVRYKDNGETARVARNWFVLTPLDAWRGYLGDVGQGHAYTAKQILELQEHARYLATECDRVLKIVQDLTNEITLQQG